MPWIEYNPNPFGRRVGDCVIRAICKATGKEWGEVFVELCLQGFMLGDLPSSNAVWSAYLKHKGFSRHTIENCPDCYTVEDFCADHPYGVYVIGTGSHAVRVCDGCAFDAWNSLGEIVVYYFEKET